MACTTNRKIRQAGSSVYSVYREGVSILNLETGLYYRMEETGMRVWRDITSPIELDQICLNLVARDGAPRDKVKCDVEDLLLALRSAGLVEDV